MVEHWRQPFLEVKPFHNGMVATSSTFAVQALTQYLCGWRGVVESVR